MVTTIQVLDASGASQTVPVLPALGQQTKAASLPVTIASDNTVVNTPLVAATAAVTVLTGTGAAQTIAANANRIGIDIFLNSTATVYLALGAAATSSNFSYKLAQSGGLLMVSIDGWPGTIGVLFSAVTGAINYTERSK